MPEIIVVGLPSSRENRARDYTPPYMRTDGEANAPAGQADRFLRFVETEVMPHVDRRYRTTATRMLAGNSRGGLFVVYSLLERPELFSARFAFSPALWRDDERIVTELTRSLKGRGATPAFVYLDVPRNAYLCLRSFVLRKDPLFYANQLRHVLSYIATGYRQFRSRGRSSSTVELFRFARTYAGKRWTRRTAQ